MKLEYIHTKQQYPYSGGLLILAMLLPIPVNGFQEHVEAKWAKHRRVHSMRFHLSETEVRAVTKLWWRNQSDGGLIRNVGGRTGWEVPWKCSASWLCWRMQVTHFYQIPSNCTLTLCAFSTCRFDLNIIFFTEKNSVTRKNFKAIQ